MSAKSLSDIWHGWEIDKELGIGSYGRVYRAVRKDLDLESYAAVKVISIPQNRFEIDSLLDEGLSEEASKTYFKGIVNDFVNEIRLMQSFKGTPNIVSIEDYAVVEKADEIGWDIYIRMELLTPFNKYASSKTLTEEDIIKLGIDICSALELCSERNIIHRDVKPENIFVNDFGFFKLGDFGIARKLENMTGGLSQKGTPFYMAPEVFIGNKYDATVDTYSLGLVMYKLLNKGHMPFLDTEKQLLDANERVAALERRKAGDPLPPPCEASGALAKVILKACAYNPNDRYKSATEFKKALEAVKNGIATAPVKDEKNLDKTTSVRSVSPAKPIPQNNTVPKSSSKSGIIIASLVALAVLVGIGVLCFSYIQKITDKEETSSASTELPTITTAELNANVAIPIATTAVSTELTAVTTAAPIDISGEPDETFTNGDFEVAVYGNNAVISDYTGSAEKVEIPSKINGYKVVAIGDFAFYKCDNLTKITIPDSVTTIGDFAFYGCDSLTEITIPNSVTTIGDYAFSGCDNLTEINIPDSVTTIGEQAFSECDNLTEINIPDSVTTIGWWAFSGCGSLTEVIIPDSVTTIGEEAFYGCDSLTEINIPDSVTTIGEDAFFGCYNLISFNVDKNNSEYCDIGGVLFSKDKTILIAYPSKKSDSVYTIPDSVTTIGEWAFLNCYSLSRVIIPDSVTTIGNYAFGWCDNLTKITIPDSVATIGEGAFSRCPNLTIYCSEDSYAAEYAKNNDIKVSVGDIHTDVEAGTIGAIHWDAFVKFVNENPAATAEEIANAVLFVEVDGAPVNQFLGVVVPVDASQEFYNGFGEEFKMGEYKAGAVFGPIMASIAYIGYIFELEEGADTAAFIENLTANCNPRWQMCVTADQIVTGNVGNKVLFLMCPATYEMPDEAFGDEEVFDGGMALD